MIDVTNADARAKLSKAVKFHWEGRAKSRDRRKALNTLYRGYPSADLYPLQANDCETLINLIQQFCTAHIMGLAWRGPKPSVFARTQAGKGFDKRVRAFLTRYSEILEFSRLCKQWALDTAFGWCVAKTVVSIAPKGVTAPVAPRTFRIGPDALVCDMTASSIDEVAFIGDIYLVP